MAGRIYVEGNELVLTMMEDDVRTIPLHTEPDYVGEFDSPEDASRAAEEWLSAQGAAEPFRTPDGDLVSISYHCATMWEDVLDDDGEPLESTAVGYLDDLTDDLRDGRLGCRHTFGRGA